MFLTGFWPSGSVFLSLEYQFQLGATTKAKVVPETCRAIWRALSPIYVAKSSREKQTRIARPISGFV
jgi:hypothetical protein